MNSIAAAASTTQPENSTFHPEDWAILARYWFPVARCVDIDDQLVQVQLLDIRLVVAHSGDRGQ
ncbi:hypothetical protein HF563_16430 [Acidithiobacillus ferridurans]|nr:hypothetical protein [Acidithiobacillus ferridurans]